MKLVNKPQLMQSTRKAMKAVLRDLQSGNLEACMIVAISGGDATVVLEARDGKPDTLFKLRPYVLGALPDVGARFVGQQPPMIVTQRTGES